MNRNFNNEILISKTNEGVDYCEESLNSQIIYYASVIGIFILGYYLMGILNKNYFDVPSSSITNEEKVEENLDENSDKNNKKYKISPESRTEREMNHLQEDIDFFLN